MTGAGVETLDWAETPDLQFSAHTQSNVSHSSTVRYSRDRDVGLGKRVKLQSTASLPNPTSRKDISMIYEPHFSQFNGKGIFTSGNFSIEAEFTVERQFSYVLFVTEKGKLAEAFGDAENWSLSGQLDDGRQISVKQLCRIKTGGPDRGAALSPQTEVIIGQSLSSPLVEARYPLVGLFAGNFSIQDAEWIIETTDPGGRASLAKHQSKSWGVPLEGLTLKLIKAQATPDEYLGKAREIMTLLSLAVGNGVTSYRQIADWGDQGTMEVWRKMTGDEIGPGAIVPDFRLGRFLEQVLPQWRQWDQNKKSEVYLAITYINLSGTGYVDTRIFQICQAWEFLATSWLPQGELDDLEQSLRNKVKSAYQTWKIENPGVDPDGKWGSRILFPFRWPVAKRQIESLVQSRDIDSSRIGIDWEALWSVRNNVAHTGRMPLEMASDRDSAYQLLTAARFGLQILLLVELGYSDLIITGREGWKAYPKIVDFLRQDLKCTEVMDQD